MIIIKSPRYRDRTVLIARYKIPCGGDVDIEILYGAYKGKYHIKNKVLINSPIEGMETRQGKIIAMRAVPLDAMERVE